MKKLIKLDFNNTTRERKTEDSYSELYSYDKNNGSFEFEILNDTLTTEQVIALFKFTESNKIWKTTGTVEGNKVNVTFDTTLITQNETVICYLYFDEEQRTSDTFRFKFKVKVSEIDKMNRYEVKERFINNTVIVDRLDVVTKEELKEALKNVGGIATEGLLTEVKAEELYAKKTDLYDDTALKQRVATLEERPDNNTVYDDSDLRGRIEALETKADNDTVYDDSDLQGRVRALEERPTTSVTAYDDTDLKRRVSELEQRPDNKSLSISGGNSVELQTNQYELRGTGMPNGVVEAPIGATYIDTAKTNGALKWIKTTDGGTTGWKVVEGDTGWLTVFEKKFSDDVTRRLRIRRINNQVSVLFEGESYGESFIKTFQDNFDYKKLMANGKITDGFKPASTISVPAHVEKNGNEGFQDAGAFLFDIQNNTFEINLFTSWQLYSSITDGLANINFNYITYEEWPTELPAQN